MTDHPPKWRRRKTARPDEIIGAALEEFADRGFAAAKLDDIARRAGISKGSLYLYFQTKEHIFRAVARAALARNLEAVRATAEAFDASPITILTTAGRRLGTITSATRANIVGANCENGAAVKDFAVLPI